jgi:hypothetical protein
VPVALTLPTGSILRVALTSLAGPILPTVSKLLQIYSRAWSNAFLQVVF